MSNRKQVNLEELPEAAQQLVKKTDWHIDEDDFVLYHRVAKKDEPMLFSRLEYDFGILSYVFEKHNAEIERTAVWYATSCSIYRKIDESEPAYVLFGYYENDTKELVLVEYP